MKSKVVKENSMHMGGATQFYKAQMTGIGWMISHCLAVSIMTAMVRKLSEDLPIFEILFFHNLVGCLLVASFCLLKKIHPFRTNKLHLHFLRASLGIVSLALYFYAFSILPLAEARAIALTGPLVSSLLAVLFLKERMGPHRITALILGFLGALLIVKPSADGFSYASLYVVGAVCLWSVIDMIIKLLGRTESPVVQLFYLTFLMTLFSTPFALFQWKTPETLQHCLWLITIGVLFLIGVVSIFNALKSADVTVVMPFDFTGMIFTSVIAYVAFSEVISLRTLCGSVIIIASSVYIAKREAKRAKEIYAKPPISSE